MQGRDRKTLRMFFNYIGMDEAQWTVFASHVKVSVGEWKQRATIKNQAAFLEPFIESALKLHDSIARATAENMARAINRVLNPVLKPLKRAPRVEELWSRHGKLRYFLVTCHFFCRR